MPESLHRADEGGSIPIPRPEASQPAPSVPRIKILSLREAFELRQPLFLIHDVLPLGSLGLLYGPTTSLKTFVALSMGLQVASGEPWHGHSVSPGLVLYIMAEGIAGLRQRVEAWGQSCLSDNEHPVWRRFFVIGSPVQFLQGDVAALLETIKSLPQMPVLIIVDTLARCLAGGDENSSHDMSVFVGACDTLRQATGATVLVVHHTGWDLSHERGSSALGAAADTRWKTERTEARLVLRCEKQKDAAESPPIHFEVQVVDLGSDGDGRPVSSCRLVLAGPENSRAQSLSTLPENDRAILNSLRQPEDSKGSTVKVLHLRTKIPVASLYRRLNRLEEQHYVRRIQDARPCRYVLGTKSQQVPLS